MKNAHPVLSTEIELLRISEEFKDMARLNGFITFLDIINHSKLIKELVKLPGMNFRLIYEFQSFLHHYDLFGLLDKD